MPTKESRLPASKRIGEIIKRMKKEYPGAKCSLNHTNAFELLVATILSAQCTDERVNKVTETLFQKYKKPADYLGIPEEQLQDEIRTTGFFRNKTKSIRGASQKLIDDFKGEVPKTMDELLSLPGVARKTANVVLGVAFGIADGIVVDTHVRRVSQRLRLTKHSDPEKIEKDLMKLVPKKDWVKFSHMLIYHGRYVCKAIRPDCENCVLNDLCPSSLV
ncbi:MAG TPA: endonuclease III [Acidobacteriota bacterium]|nr:endonuclease III [Acidobacteriota bacterium]